MFFQHKILKGGFEQQEVSTNDTCDKMMHKIRKIAKEALEESRGFGHRVKNLGGGTKVFKLKLESKGNISKIGLDVKMLKLGKIIKEPRKRSRRRCAKQNFKILMGYINP